MDLIQSIKNFLQNDETKFNEFKNYSGQFRQVIIKYDCKTIFNCFINGTVHPQIKIHNLPTI